MHLRGPLKAVLPVALVVVALAAITRSRAPADALADLRKLTPFQVSDAGFTLSDDQELSIEAVGAPRTDYWAANAWILDVRTREVKWELSGAQEENRSSGLAKFEGTLRLPAGDYLVRYAMFAQPNDLRSWITRALGGLGLSEDFRITVRGTGSPMSEAEVKQAHGFLSRNAFVSFTGLSRNAMQRTGFSVGAPTDIEIYAIGEATGGEAHDYCWLTNVETGEVLWTLDPAGSEHAGGAEKNRMDREVLTLAPGSYAAFAVTDGSHDAGHWNAAPPYDPEYWGLTIRALSGDQEIEVFPYRPTPLKNAFISLIGIGDNEAVSQAFTLTTPMEVRVRALGEAMGETMYDHGWILDADSHRPVWTMQYESSSPAGGSGKNRVVDETILLDAGNYVVYYVTDGSHSFDDWNAAPPMDPDHWGITLQPATGAPTGELVRPFDPIADVPVVAAILGVRDDESRAQDFTLTRATEVRVYALGEGSSGDMYDYAWIEDADTGLPAWQMIYDETEHAGGATKNRVFDGIVTLPAGEYILHYESDGSHSPEGWNAAAPYDPLSYGVRLTSGE